MSEAPNTTRELAIDAIAAVLRRTAVREFIAGAGAEWVGKGLHDAVAYLRGDADLAERLRAAQKRANEEATAASWFAEQNEIEQAKRRAAEGERDALASVKCCETCSDGGPHPAWNDCPCEYAEECHPTDGTPLFGRWTPASQEQLSEWGRMAGECDDMRDKYHVAQARVRALQDRVTLTRTVVGEMRNKRDAAQKALASCRKALETLELVLVTALKDTLLATKCCETCANGYDCCCEWQAGDPDDCKPGAWGHWVPATVNEILRRKSQADETMGRETPTTAYVNRKEGQR